MQLLRSEAAWLNGGSVTATHAVLLLLLGGVQTLLVHVDPEGHVSLVEQVTLQAQQLKPLEHS